MEIRSSRHRRGMIASENEEYIKHATFLATQAKEPVRHYEHKEIGYNYRMSNITAGVGRGQLLHLDEHIAKKKAIYETYKDAFKDYKQVHMNPYEICSEPNFWLSCMTIDEDSKTKPLDIIEALERENIEAVRSGNHYINNQYLKGANSILITKMIRNQYQKISLTADYVFQVILRIQKKIWIGS